MLLSASFLSVDRMLITARMTLATHLLSKIVPPPFPIYGAFVAAHFFNDKFNYARRGHPVLFPSLSRAFFETSGSMTILTVVASSLLNGKPLPPLRPCAVYLCNSSDMTLVSS
jgi:hypothetical protein